MNDPEKRKEEPAFTGSDLEPVKDADTPALELEDGPGGLAFESGDGTLELEQ